MPLSLGEAVLELAADRAQLTKDLQAAKREAESSFTGLGRRINRVMTTAIVGGVAVAGTAMAGVTASGVKMAADFETQMAILSTAVGDTGASMQDLHDAALRIGGDTELVGVSASGAAEAMTIMAKAGLDANAMFGDMQGYLNGTAELGGALRAAIDLAAASELSMAEASDVVTIAMATFGLSADDAVGIANNFVQTADASVAEVSGLRDALINVGPTAAAFGWTLEDVNVALALLSTRGIQGSEAGTALKSMMTNLMRPTDDVTEALQELNVSLYDQEGRMRSLPDIIGQLSQAMAGMTEEERNHYVQLLAGTYGMKAMNTLLAEGVPGWEKMEEAVAGAATIQEIAAARTATFEGKMEALEGAIETVMIGIGEAFLPILTDLVEMFAGFVERYTPQITAAFGALGDAIKSIAGYILGVVEDGDILNDWLAELPAFLQPVMQTIGGIINVFQNWGEVLRGEYPWEEVFPPGLAGIASALGDVIQFVSDHMEAFKGALKGIAAVLAAAALASTLASIAGAIAALANPITAVIAAVALLSAAWAENWGGIRDKTQAVIEFLKPYISAAVSFIQDKLDRILGWWNEHKDVIVGRATEMWQGVKNVFVSTIPDLLGRVRSFLTDCRAWWDEHKGAVTTRAASMWSSVRESFDAGANWISTNIVGPLLERLRAWWQEHGDSVKTIVDTLWGGIRDTIENVSGVVTGIVDGLVNTIKGFWSSGGSGMSESTTSVWDTIRSTFESMSSTISDIVASVVEALKGFWNDWGDVFEAVAGTTWDNLKVVFETSLAVLGDLVDAFAAVLKGDWQGAYDSVTQIVTDLWAGVREIFANDIDMLKSIVSTFMANMTAWWAEHKDEVVALATGLWESVKAVAAEAVEALKEAISGFFATAQRWWDEHKEQVSETATGLWEGVKTAFSAALEQLKDWVNHALGAIRDWWTTHKDEVAGIVGALWESIETAFSAAIELVQGWVSGFLADVSGWWASHKDEVAGIASTLWETVKTTFGNAIDVVKQWVGDFLTAVKGWWGAHKDEVIEIASNLWEAVKDAFSNAIEVVKEWVSDFFASVQQWWSDHKDEVAGIASALWEAIQSAFSQGIELAKQLVSDLLATVKGWWEAHKDEIGDIVAGLWENIKAAFESALVALGQLSSDIVAAIKSKWEDIDWAAVGQAVIDALSAVFNDAITTLSGIAEDIVSGIKGKFEDIDWAAVGQDIIDAITGALDGGLSILDQVAEDMVGAVTDKFTSFQWSNIGDSIIEGIKGGIEGAKQKLIDAVTNLAGSLPGWVKGPLGIHSPSQVFYEIGLNLMEGLAAGILEGRFGPIGALEEVARQVTEHANMLLDIGGKFSSIGSTAARRLKASLSPVKDQIRGLDDTIESLHKQLEELWGGEAPTSGWRKLATTEQLEKELQLRKALMNAESARAALTAHVAKQEERIYQFQKKQQDLAYLQAQVDLLELISEYKLDAAHILQGLTLGVAADADDLMDAMTKAMEEMIKQTETVLDIHSPSKVFAEIGEALMTGLAEGIAGSAYRPAYAVAGAAAQTISNVTYNVHVPAPIGSIGDLTDRLRMLEMASR